MLYIIRWFSENNFTLELHDLETVIDWVLSQHHLKEEIDFNNITLIGHSHGGGIVTIKAVENKHVTKVILWNGVSDFGSRFPKEKALADWKNKGVSYILNERTHQQMPHLYQFYQDFKKNEARFTIKNAVKKCNKPQLIIAGEKDEVVPVSEAKNMHLWNPNSNLFIIPETNHSFDCEHPWGKTTLSLALEEAVTKSIQFIITST